MDINIIISMVTSIIISTVIIMDMGMDIPRIKIKYYKFYLKEKFASIAFLNFPISFILTLFLN